MLEELRRRNYSPDTIRGYVHAVEQFATYFRKSPELLGLDEIGDFQLHLLEEKKLALGTIALRMGALRFLYKRVLKRRDLDFENLPLLKTPKKLPVVLSPEEVTRLIEAAPNLLYRTLLMLLYATGLRRTEASRLRVCDIDSSLMLIHVRQGKGARDRELPLTQKLLDALRHYWRSCKIKPRLYLFPSHCETTAEEKPISDKTIWNACHESALRAGINKRMGPHTLRHYAASQTMPLKANRSAEDPPGCVAWCGRKEEDAA
jgi:integrase